MGEAVAYKICTSLSRRITTPAPHHSFFTDWMLFLPPINSVRVMTATNSMTNRLIKTNRKLARRQQIVRYTVHCVLASRQRDVPSLHLQGHSRSLEHTHTHTTELRPFFRDHPGEPVPEENFWTLWCKGRLTEADTPTIRLGPLHPD